MATSEAEFTTASRVGGPGYNAGHPDYAGKSMSSEAAIKLSELMISHSPFLRERFKDIAQYTDPDCPLPVGFHGAIGQQIAKDYDALPAWDGPRSLP